VEVERQAAQPRRCHGREAESGRLDSFGHPRRRLAPPAQGGTKSNLLSFAPGSRCVWSWYDPREGAWTGEVEVEVGTDGLGVLGVPPFPEGAQRATSDWAARLRAVPAGP
jgi:hypothetical protein